MHNFVGNAPQYAPGRRLLGVVKHGYDVASTAPGYADDLVRGPAGYDLVFGSDLVVSELLNQSAQTAAKVFL